MQNVLIVDDEEEAVFVLSEFLNDLGYKTKTAYEGRTALDLLEKEAFDVMLLDLRMPRLDGEGVLKSIQKVSPRTATIITTGFSDGGLTEARVREYDIAGYIEKPINLDMLEMLLKSIKRPSN